MKKAERYNHAILEKLSIKYGYTKTYIRACLRGDRVGEMPDILTKEYRSIDKKVKEVIE